MTKIFEIPESKLKAITTRADKIAKRAERHGFPAPTVKLIEKTMKTVEVSDPLAHIRGHENNTKTMGFPMVTIEVEGCEPRLGEWNIVGYRYVAYNRAIPGEPPRYFHTGDIPVEKQHGGELCCDHCNTKRRRSETLIVCNDAGDAVEVGSTCLADFVGAEFNEGFLGSVRDAGMLLGEIESASNWSLDDAGLDLREEVRTILAVAASIVRSEGFINYQTARDQNTLSTSSQVTAEVHRLNNPNVDQSTVMVIESDFQQADQIITFFNESTDDNPFFQSVRDCIKTGLVEPKNVGLLSAAAGSYLRIMEEQKAREKGKSVVDKSSHVGEINKSETFTATVKDQRHVKNAYSDFWAITFVDGGNNLYSWLTNGKQDFVTGDRYEFKATVKAHGVEKYGDFKGASVTQLKNVKAKQHFGPAAVDVPVVDQSLEDELDAVFGF
jgi:hypothetical protein